MSNHKNGSKHVAPKKKRTNSKFKDFFNRLVAGFKALSKGKKALIISLCSVILVLSIAIGVVLGVILDITKDYNHQEIDDPEIDKVEQIDDEIVNIALFFSSVSVLLPHIRHIFVCFRTCCKYLFR